MSHLVTRAVIRQTFRLTGRTARRFESTTAKATETVKDTASKASQAATEYKSKASEGLSRVTSSAGPAISGAAKRVGSTLGRIGGPIGSLIGFVERQIPPTIYYARVGFELANLVFHGQKMTPPPISAFQSYFQSFLKVFRNPSSLFSQAQQAGSATPESILNQIRNLSTAQLVTGGVILAEVLGFFTIGEMIGRLKLVGYRGEKQEHH